MPEYNAMDDGPNEIRENRFHLKQAIKDIKALEQRMDNLEAALNRLTVHLDSGDYL